MIEKNLIGCILNKNNVLADVSSVVAARDFTSEGSRDIYKFCLEMWRADKVVDLPLVFSSVKGVDPSWLAESTSFNNTSMAVSYAEKIAEKAKLGRLRVSIGGVLEDDMSDSDTLVSRVSDIVISECGEDEDIADSGSCVAEFGGMIDSGGVDGYSTGYDALDILDIKLVKGDYWVIGASTSVGKTAFAINIFCNLLAETDAKICMISTEMTRKQIMSRLVAYFTNIASIKIMRGKSSQHELETIHKCLAWLKKIFFVSEKTYEIANIENRVRSLKMKHGVDVVFVDYLQHCRSNEYKDKYAALTNISSRLQELGKVADVCCVALSQLSNDYGKNGGSIQFKGSGDIAGDCDVGIILVKSPKTKGRIQGCIDKNRHGSLGEIKLDYNKNYSKLEECY